MILTILIFLIILAVLIFVHELGHFVVAKLFGIRVDEFALGFPPRLWSKKIGETEYSLNAVPFGGYVKIFGEDPTDPEVKLGTDPRSFQNKSKWIQCLVLLAGVTMNVIFGWLLFSAGYMIGLPGSADDPSVHLSNVQLTITDVLAGSPADKAGLVSGDTILDVTANGSTIQTPTADQVSKSIQQSSGSISMTYETMSKQVQTVAITPTQGIVTDYPAIGISMDDIGTLRLPVGLALLQGAQDTGIFIKEIIVGLWQLVVTLVHPSTTVSALSQVTGPVGIAKVVGQARAVSFAYLLSLVAFISLNLAVINLVPIPALDGGRIALVVIEGVRRKPINPRTFAKAVNVSFMVLLALVAVITLHDIYNLL